jgi:hypothetical protein
MLFSLKAVPGCFKKLSELWLDITLELEEIFIDGPAAGKSLFQTLQQLFERIFSYRERTDQGDRFAAPLLFMKNELVFGGLLLIGYDAFAFFRDYGPTAAAKFGSDLKIELFAAAHRCAPIYSKRGMHTPSTLTLSVNIAKGRTHKPRSP